MEFRLENEIPVSAQELWHALYTPEFDSFVARECELYPHVQIKRQSSSCLIRRQVRIRLACVDMPDIVRSAVKKVFVGDEIIYEEIQKKNSNRFEMRWRIHPPVFKEKFHASGVLRLASIDGSRCLRIMEGRIHVGLFGVGGLLERITAEQVKRTSDQFCQVVAKWNPENAECGGRDRPKQVAGLFRSCRPNSTKESYNSGVNT
ncbi:MAG TPA: DUF2505 family protein [Anaerolineae bacterium]|nr:DUF2505 family protein [Anaerolineae bacterium]